MCRRWYRRNEARSLLLTHFWPLLKWWVLFEVAGAVAKIGLSLKLNHHGTISSTYVRGICAGLLLAKKFVAFCGELHLANGAQIWQMAHKSGEFQHTNLVRNAQFELMKLNVEFFAERCAPASFRFAHKVWWNRPHDNVKLARIPDTQLL